MCAWHEGDTLLLEIKAGHARKVTRPRPLLLAFPPQHLDITIFLTLALRVMRRANEEVHSSLVKQRKETKRAKAKVDLIHPVPHANYS